MQPGRHQQNLAISETGSGLGTFLPAFLEPRCFRMAIGKNKFIALIGQGGSFPPSS